MRRVLAGAAILLLGGVVRQARAEGTGGELVPKQRPTTKSFYGWQILATGEVGALLAAAAAVVPDKPIGTPAATAGFVIGMPAYALGGPIVHWTHNDFTKGLVSFGGNFVFPLTGGLVGQGVACGESAAPKDCGSQGFFTGFAIGLVLAPIVDTLVLGWEDVPVEDVLVGVAKRADEVRHSARPGLFVMPTAALGPRGTIELGFSGRF